MPVGVSVGIQDLSSDLVHTVGDYLDQGYQRVKIKIMPGRDVTDLRAVRKAFPDARLMTDANSSYTLDDIPHLQEMDEFGLMMHEQPLGWDDIVDHAKLQGAIRTPVCLDESILTVSDARKAVELGSCTIINVKIGRLGGHEQVRQLHDFMLAKGLPVWCGGCTNPGSDAPTISIWPRCRASPCPETPPPRHAISPGHRGRASGAQPGRDSVCSDASGDRRQVLVDQLAKYTLRSWKVLA